MAVYSMTGYASASAGAAAAQPGAGAEGSSSPESPVSKGSVTAELRSVNGRFLDLSMRLPDDLRGLEPVLRELLSAAFRRGKIELRLSSRSEADAPWPSPQSEQLHRLSRLEDTVHGWLPDARGLSVNEVLQWCKGASLTERLDEPALAAAREAVAGLREAREREGERLAAVLLERVTRLRELAAQAEPLVPAVVERQQRRFLERWNTAAAQTISREALQERALNEAAAFSIRVDVAEELARLRSHLDEIARLLELGGEMGKRLDFLIQELMREANTLGSKAAALELTNISVDMKVAIEQLREQVQNIE